LSEAVACELFDTAVNLGRHHAISIMQQALNLLNRNGMAYSDIVEDGLIGMETRAALALYFRKDLDENILVKVMNHLQAGYYIYMMKKYPMKRRFVGWFART
jgi:lysozyme family protein